jgi:predicted alpha-1,6-mannanase (GH76 family)
MSLHSRISVAGHLGLIILVLTAGIAAQSSETAPAASDDGVLYARHAKLALETMQKSYDLQTGLYQTTGWWNSANLVTTLADYSRSQDSHSYDFVFSNTLATAQKRFPGFINEYYDDEGWWALAWIDVYERTHDARFLEAAAYIFKDMTYGWDDACSGGIWWSKDRRYKNAIANELFLSVAAKLAVAYKGREQDKEYMAWAVKEWAWFSHSGMINESHLVNDGLTAGCTNNRGTTWTYNQGVILGGLASLSQFEHDPSILSEANAIAHSAIPQLSDQQGILHDPCEPRCGTDGTQFKGIFVRNLSELYEASSRNPTYASFILSNARSIWGQVHPPDYQLGEVWAAPFGAVDASTQGSALDVLVAATIVSHK